METQLRFATKEEIYKMIDAMPGDRIMILTLNIKNGISDNGKMIRKTKGKKLASNANTLVLCENYPLATVSLHKSVFTNFTEDNYCVDEVVKSILLGFQNRTDVLKYY